MFHADAMYELARDDHRARLTVAARRREMRVERHAGSDQLNEAVMSVGLRIVRFWPLHVRAARTPAQNQR